MVVSHFKRRAYEKKLRKADAPAVFLNSFEEAVALDVKKPIRETEFVILDTETTGLKPEKGDCLLSIAGLGFANGRVDLSKSFYELMNPGRDIPAESVIVHNLTPDQFTGLPSAREVLIRFFDFCGGAILVGHHTAFDVRFLNDALETHFDIAMANRVLDTALIARGMQSIENPTKVALEGTRHVSLDELAKRFDIGMPDRHDAYGDALVTALIFQRQTGLLRRENICRLKDLLNMGEVK